MRPSHKYSSLVMLHISSKNISQFLHTIEWLFLHSHIIRRFNFFLAIISIKSRKSCNMQTKPLGGLFNNYLIWSVSCVRYLFVLLRSNKGVLLWCNTIFPLSSRYVILRLWNWLRWFALLLFYLQNPRVSLNERGNHFLVFQIYFTLVRK